MTDDARKLHEAAERHRAPTGTVTPRYRAPVHAHLVRRRGLTRAYVLGLPITAMCGHRFIPTRDPAGLPPCRGCAQVRAILVAEQW